MEIANNYEVNKLTKPIKVVGIDASLTGTGLCRLNLLIDTCETALILTKHFGVDRLITIRDRVLEWCQGAELIVIEGYAYGKQNQAHQMGELGGVLRVALTEAGLKWVEVAPTAVKKFATGKGTASKEEVAVGIYKRWGKEFPNNNEADAFALCKIGEALALEPPGLTAFQKEVMETIKSGKANNKENKPKKSKKKGVAQA